MADEAGSDAAEEGAAAGAAAASAAASGAKSTKAGKIAKADAADDAEAPADKGDTDDTGKAGAAGAGGSLVGAVKARPVLAGVIAVILLVVAIAGFASCAGGGDGGRNDRTAGEDPNATFVPSLDVVPPAPPDQSATGASPGGSAPGAADPCGGLITPAQASSATGLGLTSGGGDAGAAADYGQLAGVDTTVRVCPFTNPAGDQLTVLVLTFRDPNAAQGLYAQAAAEPGRQALSGLGDAAVSDGRRNLLIRRGANLVLVDLVMPGEPEADQTAKMRAVATVILPKL